MKKISTTIFFLFFFILPISQTFSQTQWRVKISVSGAQIDRLSLGIDATATSGRDFGLDRRTPPPIGSTLGNLAFLLDDGTKLQQDVRPLEDGDATWRFIAEAKNTPIILSWEELPEGVFTIHGDGKDPVDMRTLSQLLIPANEQKTYQITYHIDEITLSLFRGWNLFSLPLILSESSQEELIIVAETEWQWQDDRYQIISLRDIKPLQGVWVYARSSRDIQLQGTMTEALPALLQSGWNIIGVPMSISANDFPSAISTPTAQPHIVWVWNAKTQRFTVSTKISNTTGVILYL